jgi:hypothetical protein
LVGTQRTGTHPGGVASGGALAYRTHARFPVPFKSPFSLGEDASKALSSPTQVHEEPKKMEAFWEAEGDGTNDETER